jgi:hypothetical protein
MRAFGATAERAVARLPAHVPVLLGEPGTAVFALEAAADRRFDGSPFFARIVISDPRATLAARFGAALGAQARSYDERRRYFDGLMRQDIVLNGAGIGTMSVYDGNLIKTMYDFILVADALLVRSQAERRVLEVLFGRRRAYVAAFPGVDADVPPVSYAGRGDTIVIWAPHRRAEELAVHAFALEERFTRIAIVCAGGALGWSRAEIVAAAEGATELARASIIVDGSDDPGTAIALAALGRPLAASTTSGAGEYIDGVTLFDPWHWKSVLSAVSKGSAMGAPCRRALPRAAELQATLDLAAPRPVADPPLVSIVVPTYNRPELLRACLGRLSQQRYPNFEIVVVNDAGADVTPVVASFPRARLVNRTQNGRVQRAINTGFEHAAGDYFAVCADDDTLHRDHLQRLVAAMRETGAKVASSNHILRFRERDAAGELRTVGFFIQAEGDLDRTELLASNPIQIWMIHRSIVAERGGTVFDPDLPVLGDYEATLAIGLRHDIVHVDHVTAEGLYTDEGTQVSRAGKERIPVELEIIYGRYPVTGRTYIEGLRALTLQHMRSQHVAGGGFAPAMRLPR